VVCCEKQAVVPLRRRDYDDRFSMTLREWIRRHQREIVFDRVFWMGIPIQKNPLDTWIYQEIIYETQPDVIVEIGSRYGGSARYFADILSLIGKGIVVTIDRNHSDFQVDHERITKLTGSSSDEDILAQVREICWGKTVMVIQDGDHRKEQALTDLRNYSPLVSVGSYFIMEDGIVDLFHAGDGVGFSKEGPLAAVEAFMEKTGEFEIDMTRERYLVTYNPKGFLKRVR